VDFAVVMGAVRIAGGAGRQAVWGDSAAQQITLGAGDDEVHGGAGDDIVGSAAGNDRVFGDEGNDILYGGQGNDTIDGGSGNDIVQLAGAGRADYSFRVADGRLVMTHRDGGTDGADVVAHVETLRFTQADTSLAGTVGRLVEAFTGSQAGVATQDAMAAAVAAGANLQQVAQALYGQAGALAALDDAAFVTRLYQNVLHRAPDSDGLAWWTARLASGATRADVALGFAGSAEKLAMPADTAFGATDVGTLVRFYGTLFGRAADEGGLNYWIAAHEHGMAITAIADAFVASRESSELYAGRDDAGFVAALYRTALGREGSAGEVGFWTGRLAGGTLDRGDVLLGFADSAEKIALVGTISTSIDTLHG
jgi:Ca2+-binding RTX toxin-like protein